MKLHSRSAAAVVVAVALSLQVAPVAAAVPRDTRDDFPTRIVRIIKSLQRFIGVTPNEDIPIPPRP